MGLRMDGFSKNALSLFLALRVGDIVSVAAGMWFVPRYVTTEEIGAVLPATSFATFLSLPIFAFAMTVMKEASALSARGERGKVKSLLCGVFAVAAVILVAVLSLSAVIVPRFLDAMRVSDSSVGILVVSASFLGCVAPVYTDALQSLKRFRSLAAVEVVGSIVRFLVMFALMPVRALAGYFAGQASLPAFRIIGSVCALRKELSAPSSPFWDSAAVRRMSLSFAAIAAYQIAPMAASLVEMSILRTSLPSIDSAGYFMVSRFSDFLYYLTFPLLLVMFPYTAEAAAHEGSTRTYVLRCVAVTLAASAVMSAVYALFGRELLTLLPNGDGYAAYAHYMPWLVAVTALTACQVFYTNAEVAAGRFGFLMWLVPLHIAYPVALWGAASCGIVSSLDSILLWFGAAALLRFAFAAAGTMRDRRRVSR